MSKETVRFNFAYDNHPQNAEDVATIVSHVDDLLSTANELLSTVYKFRRNAELDSFEIKNIKRAYDKLNKDVIDSIHQVQLSLDNYGQEDSSPFGDGLDAYASEFGESQTNESGFAGILGVMSVLDKQKRDSKEL